jgi:hypothetical protein
MSKKTKKNKKEIKRIEITDEKMTGRGGINLFLRYTESIRFYKMFSKIISNVKGTSKGLVMKQFIKQMLAYFIDGTEMSISSFDRRREDEGYSSIIENEREEMASSHQIKRFFRRLMLTGKDIYRAILHQLFIWRLKAEKPEYIILFCDTMVMDNDDARKREGVEWTYKKKKGFQPMNICWGKYFVDALFRSGSTHSNHGREFIEVIETLVRIIRRYYREDVPIILVFDSGFLSEENFEYFEEELKIHYVSTGKKYEDIREYIS